MATAAGQELRSTNRPIYGASIITLNDKMYIYGGFYNVAPWNKEALWILSSSVNKLTQLDTDPFASPAVIYNTLESIDSQTIFSFGGHLDPDTMVSSSVEHLRYYKLDLSTNKWTPLQKKNVTTSVPIERFWHTTVQFDSMIYLLGGINATSGLKDTFYKYNPRLDTWFTLNATHTRCGHTSTITNDGKMIVLGGFDCAAYSFIAPAGDKSLYPLSNAAIFNTLTTQWSDQRLGGPLIPHARSFHTAVKSNATLGDDKIIISGGQDGKAEPFQNYLSGKEFTAILDIKSWQWSFPDSQVYQPFPRSFAVASLVNETKMAYGLGLNYHTVYDGFYVFDIETNEWESPMNDSLIKKGLIQIADHMLISTKLVIGLSVGASLLCTLILGYWLIKRHRTTVSVFFKGIKKSIWNKRQGEPAWAEMTRFLFRFSFLALFMIVSAVLVIQIQNSPIIDQIHHDHSILTSAPDVRFCFDGGPTPKLQCTTDYGQSCTNYIQDITKLVASNVNYYGSTLTCYLFHGNNVQLGNDRRISNGSHIQFYYHYPTTNLSDTWIIHVELYHPLHNPNIPLYTQNSAFDGWYSEDEMATFQAAEQANLKTENVYTIQPLANSQLGYQFTRREKIDLTTWNYIGFGTQRETMYQIQSNVHHSQVKQNKGSLTVYPSSDSIMVIREQRAFTAIHGMGIIGGIFGLILGIQANLFGYRPRSPWGIVHRWSIRLMQRSLLKGLRSRFSNNVHIPIIHPVHRRYSEKSAADVVIEDDDDNDRMIKLEERLHVFEMLFQAYYIDDEVFQSLSNNTDVK